MPQAFILAAQHVLTMFGSTVSIPVLDLMNVGIRFVLQMSGLILVMLEFLAKFGALAAEV